MPDATDKPVEKRIDVAVATPLRRTFSYVALSEALPEAGTRLKVPFGQRQMLGVALGEAENTPETASLKLKPVSEVLDVEPSFSSPLLELLRWSSAYYHHPIGEVFAAALPKLARRTLALHDPFTQTVYRLCDAKICPKTLKNAPAQKRLLDVLRQSKNGLTSAELKKISTHWRAPMKALLEKGIVETVAVSSAGEISAPSRANIELSPEQAGAVKNILPRLGAFHCHLLNGVTGSGKTEVYFALIDEVLARNQQALVLLPEIALTTQLVSRFEKRFGEQITVLHSGLSDSTRYAHWWRAKTGHARVVLGTRSAVFSGFADLGLIILDEEHDASFKQQEGFRYHARSVALKRGQIENVPVVLGSATPSLESLHNVALGRFSESRLSQRIGVAQLPDIHLIDTGQLPTEDGLSQPLLRAIKKRLDAGQQSLIFINRRGFAPVLYCTDCGYKADCPRCDAPMAVHQRHHALHCHHCGRHGRLLTQCPDCEGDGLVALGEGTQRVEEALAEHFPQARIQRFDRDLLQSQQRLEAALTMVKNREVDILVGTQLLTKGHDFPQVTLVGVVNADSGLHSTDFRATETLFQQLMQVAGRAGRGELPGQVLIQTRLPQAAFFESLIAHDYAVFCHSALAERKPLGYPPFGHLALWRANSLQAGESLDFLREVAAVGQQRCAQLGMTNVVFIFDAIDSPMPKRAGRYRAQLMVKSSSRGALHRLLGTWIALIEESKRRPRRLRWSVDVDPIDLY